MQVCMPPRSWTLLIRQDGRNIGFGFKLTRSPKVTPSVRSARGNWCVPQFIQ
ncbi:hypothetical protein GSU3573 [Geobacter sulfurreducens PCA]|uniref:Uncharacterized protein n=1 Tax=Geobacter sulfurreducens (strain ATCC 51573 / DSM 12127 / PCA) TaxID=243231 RepID=I7FKC9_GEOSL|nr:hypothetical protein KN400_3474 [Geobacter sulfurreducens KN400]AFP20471.1 hypothetical protein GSU3573 [Geobacter sulfurreducens PCA]HBB68467.1 hypothetical protein [Geobacter sulfurreducens]HCD94803.1 hypothetical protein [Geobacter sulfurreducens]